MGFSFFLTNKTGAPHSELLGRINPLSNNSCSWVFSSLNSVGAIRYGCWAMGGTSRNVFIDTSTSHSGGSSSSYSGNTYGNSFTTWIFFSCGLSTSKFKMYARYPIHPFLSNFRAVILDTRLVGLEILSPSKTILLPSSVSNITTLV